MRGKANRVLADRVGDVFAVQVRESDAKPVQCSDGFFWRQGAVTQKLSRDEIRDFFRTEGVIRKSLRRNAVIADLLHRIDFIEKAGTGIRRIRDGAKAVDCPEPEFEAGNFVTVTFRPNPEVRQAAQQQAAIPPDAGRQTISATNGSPNDNQGAPINLKQAILAMMARDDLKVAVHIAGLNQVDRGKIIKVS